jgi:hypothetical protein
MDSFEATDRESSSEHETEHHANISTPIPAFVPLPATELVPAISPTSDRDRDAGIETEVEGDNALAQSPSDARQINEISYELPRLTLPSSLELHEMVVTDMYFDGGSGGNDRRLVPLSAASGRTNEPPSPWHEDDLGADNGEREVSSDEADHLVEQVLHWSIGGIPNHLGQCDGIAEDPMEAVGRAEMANGEDSMTGASRRRVSLAIHS